ncbi:DUF3883 domain-containing protein [Mesorhizobium sp. ESP7-2]|uniref:protein NO VEIN domain-containing protein n=1 Tax=Mesorhizobium sp. ESP7-2 TaxID=2876622 RepID=UPI001CC9896C|nr:DUF3883 domain-containing protein [Mesorhizobium sp. ESP7-2]MBZ9711470.1 DUF3883 domain-containing protein [Mesorhizobium sp. ESP7-2]
MRELPSHGRCHAAFLLAFSATLKVICGMRDWIEAASSRASFLAAAGDIAGTAQMLLQAGLATDGEHIRLDGRLARLSQQADRPTLVGIAALLLLRYPPGWISSVVIDGQVELDLIPTTDRERLEWLGPDLVPLIFEVHRALVRNTDDALRKQIGNAGEAAVMSALRNAGFDPSHVALISDVYGYDIEYADGRSIERVEVKTSINNTSDRFFVSRNEFDKAAQYGATWRLIQVVFSSQIILDKRALKSNIVMLRELKSDTLRALAPSPTAEFRWIESAEFRPPVSDWRASNLDPEPGFNVALEI